MSFPYSSIYLNFNRIDMKKELCCRKSASSHQLKHIQETQHSPKKQVRQPTRRLKMSRKMIKKSPKINSKPSSTDLKVSTDSQQFETNIDTPNQVNLEDYLDDIDSHLIELDRNFHRSLQGKTEFAFRASINPEMRKVLVKWLIKVAEKFKVKSETLHMCIQIIDLMLIQQGNFFNRSNFQLLGVTSLFVSCKYHEIYTIEAEKYVELCDGIYSVSQLFQMEGLILLQLGFNLQIPTLPHFFNRLTQDCSVSCESENLIRTLIDMALLDFNTFNNFSKYELCSAIAYFTSKLYNMQKLKSELVEHKNRICPQKFNKSFIAAVTLFKKFQSHSAAVITNTSI